MSEQLSQSQWRYRKVVVALCFLVTLLNYFDRSIIAYAIGPIQSYFHINNTLFGLTVTLFGVGAVLTNIMAGFMVDRYLPRRMWFVAVTYWSVIMILQGFAMGFTLFLWLRFLLGTGESMNFAILNKSISDWFDPKRASRYLGLALVSVPLSNFLGAPMLSHMIVSFGWRLSFIILGAAGLVLMVVWLFCLIGFRFPVQPYKQLAPEHLKSKGKPLLLLKQMMSLTYEQLKDKTLLSVTFSFFAFGYVLFFCITWLPGYLEQTFSLSLKSIGYWLMLPWGLSCITIFLGGVISDYLMVKTGSTRKSRILFILVCQLLGVILMIPIFFTDHLSVIMIFLSFGLSFLLMPNAPYYNVCSELYFTRTGLNTGIMITAFSLAVIVTPVLSGWLSEVTHSFYPAFFVMLAVVVLSLIGLFFFAKPEQKSPSSV